MASLAIYVLTLDPAFLEETAPFTLATILSTVFYIFMPLLPFMFVPAICTPAAFVLYCRFCLTNVVLSHCKQECHLEYSPAMKSASEIAWPDF